METAGAMIPGPPHRVSKVLAGSLRVSLTRSLKKWNDDVRVEEVRALLEQGAEVHGSMVQLMPTTTDADGYFNYLYQLDHATQGRTLSALVDGGWRRESIAECVEQMERFKTKMYSAPDLVRRKWNEPTHASPRTNLDIHNDIISRLQGAMPRAMSEAGMRESAASSRVVPPGIDNASEVLDAPRNLSATEIDADARFLLGYFDLQASRAWAPEEQPGAGAALRCTFYAVDVRGTSHTTKAGPWLTFSMPWLKAPDS